MYNEFLVVLLSTLRYRHDISQKNFTLERSVLDIAKLVRGEQEVSRLLHPEAIVLKHLAREDNMFFLVKLVLNDYIMLKL